MRKSRVLTGALVAGSFTVASLFAAAPASAATLPDGQQITVVDDFSWNFYFANPDTAALTAVGSGSAHDEFENVTAIDVDNDGYGWAFSSTYDQEGSSSSALFRADANTGTLTDGKTMSVVWGETDYPADECTAIDYTDGVVLGICYDYDDDGEGDYAFIGTVDTDGAVLNAATVLGDEGFIFFSSMAVDPTDGTTYGFTFDDSHGVRIAILNLNDDYPLLNLTEMTLPAFGADFDSSGQLWISTGVPTPALIDPGDNGLATLDLDTSTNPFSAPFDPQIDAEALTVWGEALPATGPGDSTAIAAGAAAFLLLGAILAVGATSRRRSTSA